MKVREQRSRARRKRAIARRRKRTYSYSIRGVVGRLRLGAKGVTWSHMLALLILPAMVALLVWFFVDSRFFIYEAEVQGSTLINAEDVYDASGLHTMSIFYVHQAQVAERIGRQVPGIVQAYVDCQLPNRVRIRIQERDVRFVWRTAGIPFLVDGEGTVMKVDDSSHQGLITIHDLDNRELQPGDQVEPVALNAASHLHSLLPEVQAFEYSKEKGVSLLDARGWRIYFGDDQALPEKVASMHAVLQKIASSGISAKFIDLRFVGSPYYE